MKPSQPIDFIDLKAQQQRIRANLDSRIARVLDHGGYIMGAEIAELEKRLNDYAGTKHCISCANGTDALMMVLMAKGVGPGDLVFVPSFTFIATAEVVSLLGATPVFVDIDRRSYNITKDTLAAAWEYAKKKHPGQKPSAIIPVDLFGLAADYDSINRFAEEKGMWVMEDAAQSFGAEYNGKKACALSPYATTSFFPAKPLGCYGDGGAIFCNDDETASIIKSIRVHGQGSHKYENVRIGLNGRLDTLQAAILLSKLDIFDDEIERRNMIAARYSAALESVTVTPKVPQGSRSVWAQYSIIAKNRTEVMEKLKAAGVPTMVYYPIPLHFQKAYAPLGYAAGTLPICEEISQTIMSLPMHPYLEPAVQDYIIEQVQVALG